MSITDCGRGKKGYLLGIKAATLLEGPKKKKKKNRGLNLEALVWLRLAAFIFLSGDSLLACCDQNEE